MQLSKLVFVQWWNYHFLFSVEISRDEVAVWCLDHSFELVELQLPEDENEEEQDECKDIIEMKMMYRIIPI